MAKLSSFLKYLNDIDLSRNKLLNVKSLFGPSIYDVNTPLGNSLEISTNDEVNYETGHLVLRTGKSGQEIVEGADGTELNPSGGVYIFAGINPEIIDGNFYPEDGAKPYEGITIHPNTDISIISSTSNVELQAKEGIFISKGDKGNRNTVGAAKDSYIRLYNNDSDEYIELYSKNNVKINPETLLEEYGDSLTQIFKDSTERFGTLNIYAGASTGEEATKGSNAYSLEVDSTTSTEKVGNINIYESLGFTGKTIALTPKKSFTLTCPEENPKLKIEGNEKTSSIEVIEGTITDSLSIANTLNLENENFSINAKKDVNFNLEDSFSLNETTGSNTKTIIESSLDEDKKRTTTLNVDCANILSSLVSNGTTNLIGNTSILEDSRGKLDIKGDETTITSNNLTLGTEETVINSLLDHIASQKDYITALEQQIGTSTRKLGIDNTFINSLEPNAEYVEKVYLYSEEEGNSKWKYEAISKTLYTLDAYDYLLKAKNSIKVYGGGEDSTAPLSIEINTEARTEEDKEAEVKVADIKATTIRASKKVQAEESVEIGSIDGSVGMSLYWDETSKSIIFAAIGE